MHKLGANNMWEFHNPVRVLFGPGTLGKLLEIVDNRRVLFLTTSGFTRRGVTAQLVRTIEPLVAGLMDDVRSNPDLIDLEQRARALRTAGIEAIVALGGGSVIDTGKVLGAMMGRSNEEFDLRTYLESGASGLDGDGVPVIAIPTTAGTGSEVTPFATVWDTAQKKKYSLSGPRLFPELAIVDPMVTLSLPRETTIVTGLDAVSQAFEAIWNRNATPITTMLATEALQNTLPTIELLAEKGDDYHLREKMAFASMLAGLAISHTRTALAHSMSYPLTSHYGVPHGLACGYSLPAILEFNMEADDGRLQELAETLGFLSPDALRAELHRLLIRLGVPRMLGKYIPPGDSVYSLVGEMFTPNRAQNNLRPVDYESIRSVLEKSLAW